MASTSLSMALSSPSVETNPRERLRLMIACTFAAAADLASRSTALPEGPAPGSRQRSLGSPARGGGVAWRTSALTGAPVNPPFGGGGT